VPVKSPTTFSKLGIAGVVFLLVGLMILSRCIVIVK
jgi:hypothetical protein